MSIKVIYPFFLFSFLCGCSSISDEDFFIGEVIKDEQIRKHLREWEKVKPEIHELIKMKQELKVLMMELDDLASLTESSLPSHSDDDTNELVVNKSLNKTTSNIKSKAVIKKASLLNSSTQMPEATKAKQNNTQFSVQLGSFSNIYTVKKIWINLKQKYPIIFKNKVGLSETIIFKNKGTLHRLKAAYFSQEEARAICTHLKAKNQNCLISNKTGKNIL